MSNDRGWDRPEPFPEAWVIWKTVYPQISLVIAKAAFQETQFLAFPLLWSPEKHMCCLDSPCSMAPFVRMGLLATKQYWWQVTAVLCSARCYSNRSTGRRKSNNLNQTTKHLKKRHIENEWKIKTDFLTRALMDEGIKLNVSLTAFFGLSSVRLWCSISPTQVTLKESAQYSSFHHLWSLLTWSFADGSSSLPAHALLV